MVVASARVGADVVVECLTAEGIRWVTGVPGTTVMDLIDSIAREHTVRFVSTRHEQVAGFMADGISRAGRDIGACLVSRGPGATNLAVAVQNAYDESVPMLVLVGQVPSSIVERRAFEEADIVAVFRPMTKWAVEVYEAGRIPELVQRAVRSALAGRPGPVVVSLPLDVLQQSLPDSVRPGPRRRSYPPAAAPAAVTEAWAMLARSFRPAILLGGGATGDPAPYLRLADRLSSPVLTTWLRQHTVPHDHDAFLGALGYGAHEVSERVVREADVLLALGCRFSEFSTNRWALLSSQTQLVHVDIDPMELGKIYPADIGIVSDARLAAQALAEAGPSGDAEPARRRQARLAELRASFDQESSLGAHPLPGDKLGRGVSGADIIRVLQRLADREGIRFVQDAPSFGPWTHRYLRLRRPGSFFGSAGGAMGWGLPAGMGIALGDRNQRVVTLSGDGSFWMVAQDFETCVREDIPVVNVVINNFAYGNTRDRQLVAHGGRFHGVFYDNPDFGAFAQTLGGYGERVESTDQLRPALDAALDQNQPAIVDVVQDQMYGLPPGLVPPGAR